MYADLAVGNPPLFPDILVAPTSFNLALQQNDTTSDILVISNTGNLNLSWSIAELNLIFPKGKGSSDPATEASWLAESPTSGTVVPGNSQNVRLMLNAGGMATGSYVCSLSISSNDPNENPMIVPVTLNVTSLPVNQPPVAVNDLGTLPEDQSLIINILNNDYDPDGSLNPSTVLVTSNPQHGIFNINPANGRITYQPASNYFGADQLSYTVQDNQGAVSNTALVNIDVMAVNDPPVLSNIPDVQFDEDQSSNLDLNSYVADVDHNHTQISFSSQVLSANHSPAGTGRNSLLLDPADLTVTINPVTHQASFSCTHDSAGIFSVMFTATDDSGAADNDTITVTVNPVNDLPVISGLPDSISLPVDCPVILLICDFVSDPETPDSNLLYQFIQIPPHLVLNYQTTNGSLQLTPLAGSSGEVQLEITVTDASGASDCDTTIVDLGTVVGMVDNQTLLIPDSYFLDQNYPNPFNPTTTICFGLPQDSQIKIDLFNLQGQLLRTIEQNKRPAGIHKIVFKADALASGIYFYRLSAVSLTGQTNSFIHIKKMILVR